MGALVVQLLLGAGVVALAVHGFPSPGRSAAQAAPAPPGARFDVDRAMALVRSQVALGPRPAGSAASRRLALRLRRLLPHGRFEVVPGGLRNVVGSLPGHGRALVIGAHYDTAAIPHFVGADDGAGGTAAVVEIARALGRTRRPAGSAPLRFVLFDGEEAPPGTPETPAAFLRAGLRGSKAYVRAHGHGLGAMVLLDYVANRGLRLPREGSSNRALWARVRAAARRVGAGGRFPARTQTVVYDDHTPFLGAGIPAVDLIDFSYRYTHTPADTVDKLSPGALDDVGETIVELARGFRTGR